MFRCARGQELFVIHTLALVSDTIYGRELLCDPVTFLVHRAEPQPAEIAQTSQP